MLADGGDGPVVDTNIVELEERASILAIASLGYTVFSVPTVSDGSIPRILDALRTAFGFRTFALTSFCGSTNPALDYHERNPGVLSSHIAACPQNSTVSLSPGEQAKLFVVAWGGVDDAHLRHLPPHHRHLRGHNVEQYRALKNRLRSATYIARADSDGHSYGGDYFTYDGPCVDDTMSILATGALAGAPRYPSFLLF